MAAFRTFDEFQKYVRVEFFCVVWFHWKHWKTLIFSYVCSGPLHIWYLKQARNVWFEMNTKTTNDMYLFFFPQATIVRRCLVYKKRIDKFWHLVLLRCFKLHLFSVRNGNVGSAKHRVMHYRMWYWWKNCLGLYSSSKTGWFRPTAIMFYWRWEMYISSSYCRYVNMFCDWFSKKMSSDNDSFCRNIISIVHTVFYSLSCRFCVDQQEELFIWVDSDSCILNPDPYTI